jgi:photosystem II stability/assembly factor-like uncharacterized protein
MAVGSRSGATANGIYKTTNGGNSWALAGNAPRGAGNGNTKVAVAPTNNLLVYASIADPVTGGLSKMLKSTDGGLTWTQLSNTPNYMGTQGWYDSTLAVDPLTADTLYAAGAAGPNSILRSQDGGATWSDISVGSNGHGPHVDHHGIDFDAAGRLLDGNDGGIWRLDNQSPVRWNDLNGNLNITQFIGIAVHPTNPNIAYGGSQDNGTEKFTGALAWSQRALSDGGFVRVDSNNPRTVYRTTQFALGSAFLQRSDDAANSWANKTTGITLSDPADFYPPYVMDPSNSSRLVLGTNRVYETTNRADAWTSISAPDTNGWVGKDNIDSLAIAPSDGNTIYASAARNLFVTNDDGKSWYQRSISGAPHIADIQVDPTNSQIAYAVCDRFAPSRVFRTTDGGVTWTDISGNLPNLPVYTIALGLATLYVGTDDGVYSSADGGASWSRMGDGLPHAQVRELVLDSSLGILAAGTHGRGLWELGIGGTATHFSVSPSVSAVTAGSSFQITVTALDILNNPATGYVGTVHFLSSDPGATLPADYSFTPADAGTHSFTVTLFQAGSQALTVTDAANRVGGGVPLTVNPAAASRFNISAPAANSAGTAFDVTVTALDPFNNIDFNYRGNVHFTTTDPAASSVLPPDTTFTAADAGIHTFAAGVTLVTAGSQAVAVADTVSGISGAASVAVTAGNPDHLVVAAPDTVPSGTAFDVTVAVQDAFNNTVTTYLGTVQFTSSDNDPAVILPPDYPFTSTDAGVHTFSGGLTLVTVGVQTITVIDPSLAISSGATVIVIPGGLPPSPGRGKGQADAAPSPLYSGERVGGEGVGGEESSVALSNGSRECIDLFRVHDLIIALEQPGERRFVNFHLAIADADGAIADNPFAFYSLVRDLNAFDAGGWDRVQVDRHTQSWAGGPNRARE